MTVKARLTQRGDGTATPSGFVGEMFGTARAGTGGKTYSNETTTAATTSNTSLASLTLNKGSYLIFATVQQRKNVSVNPDLLYVSGRIGGTIVYPVGDTNYISVLNAGQYVSMSIAFPVEITADGTAVAVWGKFSAENGAAGNNIISAICMA